MTEQFFRGDYMPHGHCYLWQPHILWTNVISDLLIATAYFSIPVALVIFMKKRSDIGYNNVFLLFSLFILFCGITHLFGIWTIWQGVYGLHGIAKAITATVSITTAFYLYKLLPELLKVPTISEYEGIKTKFGDSRQENKMLTSMLEGHEQTKWMLDSLPLNFVLANEAGEIVFTNDQFKSEFGEISGNLSNYLKANSQEFETLIRTNGKALALDKNVSFVGQIKTEDKTKIVEIIFAKKEYGGEIQLLITLKNLKETVALKEQLVESNALFERATSATNDGIWDWNIKTGKQVWTPKLFELIGVAKSEEASYETWFNHIHPDFQQLVQTAVDEHLKNRSRYEVEYLGRNAQGEYGWFLTRGDSICDSAGNPVTMSGSLRYIDEQKKAQRLLDERTQFLEALYLGTNHAIWVVEYIDGDFKYITYNNTALKWANVTQDDVSQKFLSELEFYPEGVKTHLYEKYNACIAKNKPIEYVEFIPFSGNERWFKTSLYPVKKLGESQSYYLIGSAVDITTEKKTQQQLADNQQFLESLLDNLVCGFYIYNLETQKNERINKTYTELLGYQLEDFVADVDLLEKFHPDDRANVLKHMDEIMDTHDHEKSHLEYRFRHKQGHWVWCYSVDSVLERDEHGNPKRMLGTFVDVSDKNEFLNKLKASNEYLEQFAFIASHDLQEPLRKISAFSESIYNRLQHQFKSDPDSEFELERLQLAATRLSKMIDDLLRLSRINTNSLALETVRFDSVCTQVLENLEVSIARTHAQISCINTDHDITVDVGLFEQVLQNLIGNAIKFTKPNTRPELSICLSERESSIEIIVEDKGIGLDPHHAKRIFEPFKRLHTREKYEGSGIGLAIVAQIIKVHNAQIRCESSEGVGTQFIINLPRDV